MLLAPQLNTPAALKTSGLYSVTVAHPITCMFGIRPVGTQASPQVLAFLLAFEYYSPRAIHSVQA